MDAFLECRGNLAGRQGEDGQVDIACALEADRACGKTDGPDGIAGGSESGKQRVGGGVGERRHDCDDVARIEQRVEKMAFHVGLGGFRLAQGRRLAAQSAPINTLRCAATERASADRL